MQHYLDQLLKSEISEFIQERAIQDLIQPGFSLSIKTTWRNLVGESEKILLIGEVSWPEIGFPSAEDWACLRLHDLNSILDQSLFDPSDLKLALRNIRVLHDSPVASSIVLLHAALPSKYVGFYAPVEILAASCLLEALPLITEWYQNFATVLPFDPNLHQLSRVIRERSQADSKFVLLNRGVLIGATDLEKIGDEFTSFSNIAFQKVHASEKDQEKTNTICTESVNLPEIRAGVSAKLGRPLILHVDDSVEMLEFITSPLCEHIMKSGTPFPMLSAYTGLPHMLLETNEFSSNEHLESIANTFIMLYPGVGSITAANSAIEAQHAAQIFHTIIEALIVANRIGEFACSGWQTYRTAEKWEVVNRPSTLPFAGEVAMVTGAASGIGKAIVESLLQRGSTVVGLDINPSIHKTFDHPCYQGMTCDVFDETVICDTMQNIARQFGGLDILVLNAGLFPSGCHIEKLTLSEFTKVINVNFIANMVILREAFPMLRLAPRYGRVVIIGSKNMRAPGPGAAAYSTSKAALTQLARVAALEWGCEGIRVNVIHPDAVFDTALYTDEVLQARAAHYGITVEQYKKRNLLKTEITSHDVAELAAEICGPLFRPMTGGQIQFDGGNDRTI